MRAKAWKRGLAAIAVTALLVAAGVLVWTQSSGERSPLGSLESSSDKPLTIQINDGVPRFMSGSVPVVGETPTERSYAYLDRHSELYALDVPQKELEVVEVESGPAGQHVHLQQQQDDVPVYGGELVVHLEGGEVVSTGGTYLAEVPQLEPETGAEKALDRARETAGVKEAVETKPELTYFDADLLMTPKEREASDLDGETHLAWKVDLHGTDADGRFVSQRAFVDAKTGEVLLSYDRIETHAAAKNISVGTANGRGAVLEGLFPCNIQGAATWFDARGQFGSPDAEGIAAWGFANQVYDYFYNTFHRHSFDDRETQVVFSLDYMGPSPLNGGNAAWIPVCQQFFFNDGMASLDIMAHEFTHGVIDHGVHGGLEYLFQSGALNESLADTFAVLIDTANWTIGERPGVAPTRDLSNPPAFNQPDKMPVVAFAANQDKGGVHTNSGIPNKAAYLLMQGGFHNDRVVQAIGRQKAALLYYEVLDNHLFTTANLSDFRNMMVAVSSLWSNIPRNGFTAADACRVRNAFAAVALPSGDADCDGNPDGTDQDGDNDGLTDAFDNCDFQANPGQEASDADGTGNACDTDDDADTLLDSADNCPQAANTDQEDTDEDGLGNACDTTPTGDSDFDGADNATDNCPGLPNPSQGDNEPDGKGDACDPDDDNDGIVDNADNCHQKANKDQKDTDGDGAGDVCDPSPNGTDTDGDGTPDASDDDDDNDGVKDGSDNCRLVKNPSQIDFDHDGVGHECDSDESLTPQKPLLSDAIEQRTRRFERIEIPVLPCLQECEPGVPMEIRLEVDIPLAMRLLDESGTVIAEGSNEKPLVFEPKEGLEYQLEILPRDVTLSEDHPLELELVPKP